MGLKIENINITNELFSNKGELIRFQFNKLSEYYSVLNRNKGVLNVNLWGNKISNSLWFKNFYSPKRLLQKYLNYDSKNHTFLEGGFSFAPTRGYLGSC